MAAGSRRQRFQPNFEDVQTVTPCGVGMSTTLIARNVDPATPPSRVAQLFPGAQSVWTCGEPYTGKRKDYVMLVFESAQAAIRAFVSRGQGYRHPRTRRIITLDFVEAPTAGGVAIGNGAASQRAQHEGLVLQARPADAAVKVVAMTSPLAKTPGSTSSADVEGGSGSRRHTESFWDDDGEGQEASARLDDELPPSKPKVTYLRHKHIGLWSTEEVCMFLSHYFDFGVWTNKYRQAFVDARVTGGDLHQLTASQLHEQFAYLNVLPSHRIRIIAAINGAQRGHIRLLPIHDRAAEATPPVWHAGFHDTPYTAMATTPALCHAAASPSSHAAPDRLSTTPASRRSGSPAPPLVRHARSKSASVADWRAGASLTPPSLPTRMATATSSSPHSMSPHMSTSPRQQRGGASSSATAASARAAGAAAPAAPAASSAPRQRSGSAPVQPGVHSSNAWAGRWSTPPPTVPLGAAPVKPKMSKAAKRNARRSQARRRRAQQRGMSMFGKQFAGETQVQGPGAAGGGNAASGTGAGTTNSATLTAKVPSTVMVYDNRYECTRDDIVAFRRLASGGRAERLVRALDKADGAMTRLVALKFFDTREELDHEESMMRYVDNDVAPEVYRKFTHIVKQPVRRVSHVLVMQCADSRDSLAQYCAVRSRRNIASSTAIGHRILTCVARLHELNIVHCDLKPQHFMLFNGMWKLVDYGSCHEAGSKAVPAFTPRYCAPEVARAILRYKPPRHPSRGGLTSSTSAASSRDSDSPSRGTALGLFGFGAGPDAIVQPPRPLRMQRRRSQSTASSEGGKHGSDADSALDDGGSSTPVHGPTTPQHPSVAVHTLSQELSAPLTLTPPMRPVRSSSLPLSPPPVLSLDGVTSPAARVFTSTDASVAIDAAPITVKRSLDMWTVGLILYELFTGTPYFGDHTSIDLTAIASDREFDFLACRTDAAAGTAGPKTGGQSAEVDATGAGSNATATGANGMARSVADGRSADGDARKGAAARTHSSDAADDGGWVRAMGRRQRRSLRKRKSEERLALAASSGAHNAAGVPRPERVLRAKSWHPRTQTKRALATDGGIWAAHPTAPSTDASPEPPGPTGARDSSGDVVGEPCGNSGRAACNSMSSAQYRIVAALATKKAEERLEIGEVLAKRFWLPAEDTIEHKSIQVLALFSNPRSLARLRLMRELQQLIQAVQRREVLPATRLSDVRRFLRGKLPRIIHFSGHGNAASELSGSLAFETADGTVREAKPSDLIRLLQPRRCPRLQAVFLNACDTKELGEEIVRHLPHLKVIAWDSALLDDAARTFSRGFYNSIGNNPQASISRAFQAGMKEFRSHGFKRGNPELFWHDKFHYHRQPHVQPVKTCFGCFPPVSGSPVLLYATLDARPRVAASPTQRKRKGTGKAKRRPA